jgi:diguanylate cyclase (GGDEF)-like protein
MRSAEGADKALEFLATLAREFTAVLSLDYLMTRVLDLLREVANFDSCIVGLIEQRDADVLTIVGATGLCAYARDGAIRHPRGPLWAAIDAGMPLSIPDTHADPRAAGQGEQIRSGIYAPLLATGRAIGAIGVHRSAVAAFTAADLDLLALLATYLGNLFEAARAHERLTELAFTDPLTELSNRRVFLDRLGVELLRNRRTGRPLSIAIVDLDDFKAVNDRYGHAAGDVTLRHVAQTMKRGIRSYDLVARYGGDEFVLLFPDTSKEIAHTISRRFREIPVPGGSGAVPIPLALSWGIASHPGDGDAADTLLNIADARLYEMKRSHRPHVEPQGQRHTR